MSIYNIPSKKVHLGPIWMRTLLPRRMIGAWHLQTYMLLCDARTSSCTHILRWGACVSQDGVSKGGGVTPMDSIVTTVTAVDQRSTVKAIQKGAVYCQSTLRSMQSTVKACSGAPRITAKQQILAGLHVRSKVKGRKSVQSTVKLLKRAGQGFDPQSQL